MGAVQALRRAARLSRPRISAVAAREVAWSSRSSTAPPNVGFTARRSPGGFDADVAVVKLDRGEIYRGDPATTPERKSGWRAALSVRSRTVREARDLIAGLNLGHRAQPFDRARKLPDQADRDRRKALLGVARGRAVGVSSEPTIRGRGSSIVGTTGLTAPRRRR